MPTFSQSLEQSLHRALAIANERHHQYATLEHLLLSLIDDSDAAAVMRACSVDLDKLRGSLVNYLETEFENLVTDGSEDAKPTARVDEVVEPPSAATPAPASHGPNVWIVALGGGVLAALMAGLLLRIRHRRASTPPAAPEAPA